MSPALLKTILTTIGGVLCVCGPIVRPYSPLLGDLMAPIGGVLLGGAHLRRPGDRKRLRDPQLPT